jgi:cyclin C
MTDLPLLYPPHIIALTAILLSLVLRPNSSAPGQTNAAASPATLSAATAALAQAQNKSSNGATSQGMGQGQSQGAGDKDRQPGVRYSRVQQYATWLAEGNVDLAAMVDCTQEIISFYDAHEQYNDKLTREQVNRFVKARGLDK